MREQALREDVRVRAGAFCEVREPDAVCLNRMHVTAHRGESSRELTAFRLDGILVGRTP